jgi:hydroxymethylpyrimidine/phosphomethylpyrimidine kinase
MKRINALTIAGTDPSGGAGIQADLKAFSALGAYGASVITALVAQNTRGVQSVYNIEPAFVAAQLDSVFSDLRIDSTKIGMLANADIVQAVAERLRHYQPSFVVLDTVMLAKSGDPLLAPEAVESIRRELLPLVCQAVLMKGGHLSESESPDWLFSVGQEQRFTAPRVATRHTHGTGCTLSAALAALRPRHDDWAGTVAAAKDYLQKALQQADTLEVGHGIGPVHHFHAWW